MIATGYTKNSDGTTGLMGDFWTLSAASAHTGYPVSNLLTNDLRQPWVSWGQRASHNWIEAESDLRNTVRHIAVAGLLGIDRRLPTHALTGSFSANTYRMLIDEYPIGTRHRPPVFSISTTNLSGVAATLNGPVDPPNLPPVGYVSTKLTSSDPAVNTVLIADFENYNATERPLSLGPHVLRLHYVHSVDVDDVPELIVTLRYAGVSTGSALTALSWERTSEGFITTYQFLGSVLPGLTGRVGVRIEGVSTGTSTPEPIGVEWIAELTGWTWDSNTDTRIDGSIKYTQIVELPEGLSVIDPELGVVPIEIYLDSRMYVYLEVSDFVETTVSTYSTPWGFIGVTESTPAGGFQGAAFYAGRFVAGEVGLSEEVQVGDGINFSKVGDVQDTRTRGGFSRGSRSALSWVAVDVNIPVIPGSVMFETMELFFSGVGYIRPFLIVLDESNPARLALWVKLTAWETPDAGFFTGDGYSEERWDLSFSAEESTATRRLRL